MRRSPPVALVASSTLAATLALGLAGCAASSEQRRVDVPELHVIANPKGPDALDVYDAEILFARGIDLLDGGAYADAAPYFERLIREFPTDTRVVLAHYNRGVCYIHLERGDEAVKAIDDYLTLLGDKPNAKDLLDGQFKRGQALAVAKRFEEVIAVFDGLLEEELTIEDRIEALVDAGVGHYMVGIADPRGKEGPHRYTAEYRFLEARRLYKQASERQRLDVEFFVAQAAFYLAEISRLEFEETKLEFPSEADIRKAQAAADKSGAPEKTLESLLGEKLEEKCQKLLRAQYAYLRTIREGHAGWASASGYNVGRMYEVLHDELVSLPAPADLSPDAAALYRKIVRKKVLILLEKAQKTWSQTAEMVTRTGAESEWAVRTRESLARMREKLLKEMAETSDIDGEGNDVATPASPAKDAG